jgi:hypothetical protein
MNKLDKKEEDCHDNIFPEIHILKTMFFYKKDLSRRVLSEYMCNSKIGNEKSMGHCMSLCDFVILAVL